MTIDQIEADAQSTVFAVEHYGMDSPSQQRAYDLAKALLLVLPVVRAAERWVNCEGTCSNATCEHDDMTMAVVTLRAALEDK